MRKIKRHLENLASEKLKSELKMEQFSLFTFTLELGLSIGIFYLLIGFIIWIEPSGVATDNLINAVLTIATFVMVLEISRQVKRQEKHLRNFEPELRLVEMGKYPPIITKDSLDVNTGVQAVNTSQTAAILEDIEIPIDGAVIYDVSGYTADEEKHYQGNVPVPPGESRKVLFKLDLEEVSKERVEELLEKQKLPLRAKGDFRTETVEIRVKI